MSHSPEYMHSELPAIKLFKELGYDYYDASKQDERLDITEVLLKERLGQSVKRINPWINDNNLNKALNELSNVIGASSLYRLH
jgi:type I restriction enzyme, R subunit